MTPPDPPPPLGARAVVGLGIGATLVPLNSTMIAVALPDIARDFAIAKGRAALLVTVYLVVMLVGQPVAGRVTDKVGSRRALRTSLMGFAVFSVASSIAGTFWLLIVGRALQAVFAAALIPGIHTLLRKHSPPDQRGRSFGMIGSFIGAGAVGGPIVGGAVTQLMGWPGVFLVNLPLVGVALYFMAGLAPDVGHVAPPSKGESGFRGVVAARTFRAAFATQSLSTLGQYSLILVSPIVLDARGWSSAEIGLALTTLTAGMIVMGPVGGRSGDRRGRRAPVVVGMAVATAGMVLAAAIVEESSTALLVAMVAVGFGLGFALPSITTSALEAIPEHLGGAASGVLAMSRYVGSIPSSILVAVLVDGIDGAQLFLVIAAASLAAALLTASTLPARPSASDHDPMPPGADRQGAPAG